VKWSSKFSKIAFKKCSRKQFAKHPFNKEKTKTKIELPNEPEFIGLLRQGEAFSPFL
jgi:hypothetical protein